MKSGMNICNVDLRRAQTKKTTTNKTKTIRDYLGGSSVHKSTCSRQLGSSLQFGLMRYFHENAFVCCVQSGEFVWNEGGVVQLTPTYITLRDFLL